MSYNHEKCFPAVSVKRYLQAQEAVCIQVERYMIPAGKTALRMPDFSRTNRICRIVNLM